MAKPIVIGCDNAAVELKHTLCGVLKQLNIPFEDVGVESETDQTLYPEVAERVCEAIIAKWNVAKTLKNAGLLLCVFSHRILTIFSNSG